MLIDYKTRLPRHAEAVGRRRAPTTRSCRSTRSPRRRSSPRSPSPSCAAARCASWAFARARDLLPNVRARRRIGRRSSPSGRRTPRRSARLSPPATPRVDPKDDLKTCRRCDLQTLCRVYEKFNVLEEVEDEEAHEYSNSVLRPRPDSPSPSAHSRRRSEHAARATRTSDRRARAGAAATRSAPTGRCRTGCSRRSPGPLPARNGFCTSTGRTGSSAPRNAASALLRVGADFLERHAEPLLARLAEVGLVLLVQVAKRSSRIARRSGGCSELDRPLAEEVDSARDSVPSNRPGRDGIDLVEVQRDRPRVVHRVACRRRAPARWWTGESMRSFSVKRHGSVSNSSPLCLSAIFTRQQ